MKFKQLDFRSFRGVMLIGFSVLSLVFLFNACTKSDTFADTSFKPADAKEWFYGSFKKAPEFSSFNAAQLGSKLPDWSKGIAYKFGGNEIVEYPLMKAKSSFTIPSDLSENEGKKIAAASLSKVLFIRDAKGKTFVREVSIVPSYDYLVKSGFDISINHFASYNKEFAGSVIISDWSGNFISGRKLANGKSYANITFKQQLNNVSKTSSQNRIGDPNCTIVIHTVWQKDCVDTYYGDVFAYTTCGEWYAVGTIEEEICGNGGGCDLSNPGPECGCEFLGTCGGGGGDDDPDPDCKNANKVLQNLANSAQVTDINLGSYVEFESPQVKTKRFEWVCLTATTFKYFSIDKGTITKVTSPVNPTLPWEWTSLDHIRISRVGIPVGGSVNCTADDGDATLGLYNAIMDLHFDITYSVVCKGSPAEMALTYRAGKNFSVNDF
jgi:hypothetical protein